MFVVIDAYLHDLTELNLITELEVAETFLIFKINSTLSNLYYLVSSLQKCEYIYNAIVLDLLTLNYILFKSLKRVYYPQSFIGPLFSVKSVEQQG